MRPTLVTTQWLHQNLRLVKILDGSWHMPNSGRNGAREFLEKRIAGSKYFDIDQIADKSSSLPHMLPNASEFSSKVGVMGITEKDHIVIYDSSGVGPACRVFWTFRVFGHENVSVLDGGLIKWINEGRETVSGPSEESKPETYKSCFDPNLVKTYADIIKAISDSSCQIIDARPQGRFLGTDPEPRSGLSSGHMPNSINIPFMNLINQETKTLLSKEKLLQVFKNNHIDINKPIIATCGSGVTASIIYFALDYLGAKNLSVYDASWREYASIKTSLVLK